MEKASRGNGGVNHYLWKGDSAGYYAIHLWLTYHFDKPTICDHCGRGDVPRLEWASKKGELSRNRDDYWVLCPSCHRKLDKHRRVNGRKRLVDTTCIHGHEYTADNIYITPRGYRECRACRVLSAQEYRGRQKCQMS